MSYSVTISAEASRGCGFRKPGADGVGIYLMGGPLSAPCERLPMPLTVCPTCSAGIKHSRSFTWIDPMKLFHAEAEPRCGSWMLQFIGPHRHDVCPMCRPESVVGSRAGLIWIGARHYTPTKFLEEAASRGVSRKLPAVPRGFKLGEDWVYLAHVDGVPAEIQDPDEDGDEDREPAPGVISVFRPTHVDLVIKPEKIDLRTTVLGDIEIKEAADEDQIPAKARRIVDELGEDLARIVIVEPLEKEEDDETPAE